MASDMCKICTYHFWINFTFLYGVFDMFSNNRTILAEQFGHLFITSRFGEVFLQSIQRYAEGVLRRCQILIVFVKD